MVILFLKQDTRGLGPGSGDANQTLPSASTRNRPSYPKAIRRLNKISSWAKLEDPGRSRRFLQQCGPRRPAAEPEQTAADRLFGSFQIAFISEPFAKFAAAQATLPANVRSCLFQYRVRPGEKCCLSTISTKVTNCVFVPFVAIPSNRPAAEFCKRLQFEEKSCH